MVNNFYNKINFITVSLSSDVEKIQAGIGDKVALFLQYMTTFLTGFVIAYAINWKLALVISVMLPLLTITAFMIAKVRPGHTQYCIFLHGV